MVKAARFLDGVMILCTITVIVGTGVKVLFF